MNRPSVYELAPEVFTVAAGGEWRRVGNRWRGPCPACGSGAFEVRAGGRGTLATCWGGGCTAAAIADAIRPRTARGFRRTAGAGGGRRAERDRTRPKGRPKGQSASEAVSRGFGGGGPSKPAKSGGPAKNDPVGSPVTHEADPPKGRSTPGIRPAMEDHSSPVNTARRLWSGSGPVPLDPEHPARRWSARRNLWPDRDPWPDAVRWIGGSVAGARGAREGGTTPGGSLVAAFAPVAAWIEGHPPAPSGVQCVHVNGDGQPRADRGGLAKRSHGSMTGAVCVIGPPLWCAGRVHVAEGIADALAVAARVEGAALAVGGTSGLARLAEPLAALSVPVTVWPDGDTPGRLAASRLALALRAFGVPTTVADVPDGDDPASLADPCNEWRQRA